MFHVYGADYHVSDLLDVKGCVVHIEVGRHPAHVDLGSNG